MKPLPGQQSLFASPRTGRSEYAEPREPVLLNASVPPHEAPRLSTQHAAILDRLREFPATNLELRAIADRFGARIEELRRAGHQIKTTCLRAGVYQYELIGTPTKSGQS